jgi:hypothetical protein
MAPYYERCNLDIPKLAHCENEAIPLPYPSNESTGVEVL